MTTFKIGSHSFHETKSLVLSSLFYLLRFYYIDLPALTTFTLGSGSFYLTSAVSISSIHFYYLELSDVPFINGFYSAERDLNNDFPLAHSAFPNLRPNTVSSDSGRIIISFHYV